MGSKTQNIRKRENVKKSRKRKKNLSNNDNLETKFNIIKWNGRIDFNADIDEYFSQRGIAHESYNGSYYLDKRFTCNKKGFVVQKIDKHIIELVNSDLKETDKLNKIYWEIFYIGEDGVPENITNPQSEQYYSFNTDGFVQADCGDQSFGHIVQVGTSNFFEYNEKVNFRDGIMEITNDLQEIFGDHVVIDVTTNANGLPSSNKAPNMTGLSMSGPTLTHTVEYYWNDDNHETNLIEKYHSDGVVVDLDRPDDYETEEIETGGLEEVDPELDYEDLINLKKTEIYNLIYSHPNRPQKLNSIKDYNKKALIQLYETL